MAASSSWPALGEMAQKSKKPATEGGKDSPEKSPPSGGESELAATVSAREQQSIPGNAEGVDADQQKGKKKGTGKVLPKHE